MDIQINIGKKHFLVMLIFVLFLGGALVVNAYGTGGPPDFVGHDFAELEGVQAELIDASNQCNGNGNAIRAIDPDGTIVCDDTPQTNVYGYNPGGSSGSYSQTVSFFPDWVLVTVYDTGSHNEESHWLVRETQTARNVGDDWGSQGINIDNLDLNGDVVSFSWDTTGGATSPDFNILVGTYA
jgi:hypothetical protein